MSRPPTIVKVQLPLPLTGTGVNALIYAEGRQDSTTQTVDTAVLRQLGGAPKGYFEAWLTAGFWSIGKRVADQSW